MDEDVHSLGLNDVPIAALSRELRATGVIVYDVATGVVSVRSFTPAAGISEDPV